MRQKKQQAENKNTPIITITSNKASHKPSPIAKDKTSTNITAVMKNDATAKISKIGGVTTGFFIIKSRGGWTYLFQKLKCESGAIFPSLISTDYL